MKRESRRVRRFFLWVAGLNLVTLGLVFLLPRLVFILQHADMSREEFLTTAGTWDLPNPYASSFELAYVLRSATPESAVLYLPPSGGRHTHPAALYRVLLPRRVLFGVSPEEGPQIENTRDARPRWLVAGPDWQARGCAGRITRPLLPETGLVLCRLDGPPVPHPEDARSRSKVSR